MAKRFQPQVMTANDLIEGDSVFLGPTGWTRRVEEARVAHTPDEAEAMMAEAQRSEADNTVVSVYGVAVALDDGRPSPVARRERIRAAGAPTIAVGPAPADARAA